MKQIYVPNKLYEPTEQKNCTYRTSYMNHRNKKLYVSNKLYEILQTHEMKYLWGFDNKASQQDPTWLYFDELFYS
jgi:hypothetical protein